MAKRSPLRSPHSIEVKENVMASESDLVYGQSTAWQPDPPRFRVYSLEPSVGPAA